MRGLLWGIQVLVVFVALAVRFLAGGWWLVILFFTPIGWAFMTVVGTPLLVATILLSATEPSRWRARTLSALAVADLALFVFSGSIVDFTDNADDRWVPLARLVTGNAQVSEAAAGAFGTLAEVALGLYLVATILVMVLAVRDRRVAVAA